MFDSRHGFVAAMWRRTLAWLRNMPRWESSPVEVQCAHTKRVTRPVPDPAGPAAAEPVTGTGTDAMITDATAASSSVLVTDIIACVPLALFFWFARACRRYKVGCTRHMPSHTLQKRFSPYVVALVLGLMPQQRELPAKKTMKQGQMAIAAKMADKVKAGCERIKFKGGNGKGNGKRSEKADASSEHSELEASEGEISSADSSLPDPEVSQLKIKRRTKPATPLVEVTSSVFNFC
jgi:hypothetical protein